MGKYDITGENYGKLIVLKEVGSDRNYKRKWLCKCECGKEKIIDGQNLKNGFTKSCGSCNSDTLNLGRGRPSKHRMGKTALYAKWKSMRRRCTDEQNEHFKNYGGRGITICEEWELSFESFMDWSLKNGYTPGLEIDRINNDQGYFPQNCRYVTRKVNCNNKRNTTFITIDDVTKPLSEWATQYGVSRITLHKRLNKGITGMDLFEYQNKRR